jgi:hypothetical protein
VEKHPDKTFIGRIAKGFDFLGYSFEPKGLSIAPQTLANFLERITQLYEQGATVRRIGQYVRNWWRWVRAGVNISLAVGCRSHPNGTQAGVLLQSPRILSTVLFCSYSILPLRELQPAGVRQLKGARMGVCDTNLNVLVIRTIL